MSLEQAIADLTTATKELTEVTESLMALRENAIETVKSTAAPKAAAAKTTKAAPAEKPAEEPAAAETPATPADFDDMTGDYTALSEGDRAEVAKRLLARYTVHDRPEEVQARKDAFAALMRNKAVCKPELMDSKKILLTDVMDGKMGVLVKNLRLLIEKPDLTEESAGEEESLV